MIFQYCIFTGQHSDYHKPGDDYHLINYDGLNKISKYILDLILDLNDNGKLKFSKTNDQNSRMSPNLMLRWVLCLIIYLMEKG